MGRRRSEKNSAIRGREGDRSWGGRAGAGKRRRARSGSRDVEREGMMSRLDSLQEGEESTRGKFDHAVTAGEGSFCACAATTLNMCEVSAHLHHTMQKSSHMPISNTACDMTLVVFLCFQILYFTQKLNSFKTFNYLYNN
jgi:hypothetical protein